jgi:hypothetical protein
MGKSFELNSARLMVGAAAIAVPMAIASTPADAGASGGGGTAFVSDESCIVCTGDITTNTPSSAIVSATGDPTNPANWLDVYFAFSGGTWETFSADEPGESALLQSVINEVLSLPSASVTYEPEDFTVVDFLQLDPIRFETEVISDSDGPVGVPEPASAALLGAAAAALALMERRRKIVLTVRSADGAAALQNHGSISIGGVD